MMMMMFYRTTALMGVCFLAPSLTTAFTSPLQKDMTTNKPFTTTTTTTSTTTVLQSSSIAAVVPPPVVSEEEKKNTIRVLALHGKEETATTFRSTMNNWRDDILIDHGIRMEIDTLEGPFDEGKGKAWWWTTQPDGARSYQAAEDYQGFEESQQIVLDAMNSVEDKPYDLVVGHSQGAMLAVSLLAKKQDELKHPEMGYILNGVAWPNPFSKALESMEFKSSPRLLFVTGMRDKVNPSDQAEQVKETFQKAGADVSSVKHPKGHAVPIRKDETVKVIMNWIVDKKEQEKGA